jgi:hypothetical protein
VKSEERGRVAAAEEFIEPDERLAANGELTLEAILLFTLHPSLFTRQ